MKEEKRLSDLFVGECAVITGIDAGCGMRRRLLDVGFMPGTHISCVGKSPFGDPRAYSLRGYVIAIRQRDAADVIIKTV